MSAFEEFWAASRYTPLHQRRLGERLRDFRGGAPLIDPLEPPSARQPLWRPKDRLQRLFRARRSVRDFGAEPMTAKQLGAVFAALTDSSYPSAGGLNPLRCYAFLADVRHELNGRAVRYDPVAHALQDVGPCPDNLAEVLGAQSVPQLALVLLLSDEATLDKYGQRGGRFGLIEAGAAAQSVCLRIAQQRLGGYLLGGVADTEMQTLLGLRGQPVRVATAVACGRI